MLRLLGPALVLLLATPQAPRALGRAGGKPIVMTARDGLDLDLAAKTGVARGEVVIRREDVVVCCDLAEARYAGDRIEEVTCKGNVVIVRPDGTRATADLAVFVAAEDQLTLTGRPRVVTPQAELTGPKIIYDVGRDRLQVEGGRSRFRFEPGSAAAPSGRACPPPGTP